MAKKNRIEIPDDIAADVLFGSNRTCCVCRERKPVQIHHIDEDPSNFVKSNLAVVCFDCHRDTQIRGGFDRKLDSAQIRRYQDDWILRVANKREQEHGPLTLQTRTTMQEIKAVKYVQIKENSEEHSYSIEAEYPQFSAPDPKVEIALNTRTTEFVTKVVDEFRAQSVATSAHKLRLRKDLSGLGWDSLSIAHKIVLLTLDYVSIEFEFQTYYAGAVHPNSITRTLNFKLRPVREMALADLFGTATSYAQALSDYCISELHKLQPPRWYNSVERTEELKVRKDDWICSGAAPDPRNFEHFVLQHEGIRIFFDPYQVGSYAEGRYEIFVPFERLRSLLSDQLLNALP